VLLATTSFVYFWALQGARRGRNAQVFWGCVGTGGIGLAFLLLKLVEWGEDFGKGKWPGQGFQATGPDPGGQHLFWILYYVGTGLHAVHMLVGLFLIAWIAWRAWRERFSSFNYTAVEVVGLYWSFVDLVWINLYPFIYLVDRR
ncbi:MAG TPA: cytochrome c oxidase subunit 3, partial [Acetobacteraceae bacterium]|nr:cytochrome c oxidase subunit 3 [Acetobacteraceae bacterium]